MFQANADSFSSRTPHYYSMKACLNHLRILSELPYPSWSLIPSIMSIVRKHIAGSVSVFVWINKKTLQPISIWVDPVNNEAYCNCINYFNEIIGCVLPAKEMISSKGRAIKYIENDPSYEKSIMYEKVFKPYGIHWGMSIPVNMSGDSLGFMGISRPKEAGQYSMQGWANWDLIGNSLQKLDQPQNSWVLLPDPDYREVECSTLWFNSEGGIIAQGNQAKNLLFLAQQNGMEAPNWVRADWRALPPSIYLEAKKILSSSWQNVSEKTLNFKWGKFTFLLEKMPLILNGNEQVTLNVTIRYFEPYDISIARALWGWPLSPQEKRILIASTRHPSLSQLSRTLGLTLGTLKNYINRLDARFSVDSREVLNELVWEQYSRNKDLCHIPP